MQTPENFDVKGIAKLVFLHTLAVLVLIGPITWFAADFFFDYFKIAQSSDPKAVLRFITLLVCAETVAVCPILVTPVSATMRRLLNARARLETLAETDALTGLLNRRGLAKAAGRLMAATMRRGEIVAAMVCDIDHFKRVNDLYGHDVGDRTLRALGALLAERFAGEAAVAGRTGGEEFLVLLRVRNPRAAETAAEALCRAFAACEIALEGAVVRCTLSVGVAAAAAPCELGPLVSRADAALYAAKAAGRNRVALAETPARAVA